MGDIGNEAIGKLGGFVTSHDSGFFAIVEDLDSADLMRRISAVEPYTLDEYPFPLTDLGLIAEGVLDGSGYVLEADVHDWYYNPSFRHLTLTPLKLDMGDPPFGISAILSVQDSGYVLASRTDVIYSILNAEFDGQDNVAKFMASMGDSLGGITEAEVRDSMVRSLLNQDMILRNLKYIQIYGLELDIVIDDPLGNAFCDQIGGGQFADVFNLRTTYVEERSMGPKHTCIYFPANPVEQVDKIQLD